MAPSSPAVPAAAMDDRDENEDAWRVGGFRVAGVRSKVFAPPPGHPRRSAQGFLVSLERDPASAPPSPLRASGGSDVPLRQLFPGNAAMHRAAESESASRRASPTKTRDDDSVVALGFTTMTQHGVDRRRRATLVRASASTPGRAFASSQPQPTTSTPSRASASPISPEAARAARRAHRKRLAQIVVSHWRWFASDALDAISLWRPFRVRTLLRRAMARWARARIDARRERRTRTRDAEETRREEARARREYAVTCLLRWEENARTAKRTRRAHEAARKHALHRACGGRVPAVLPAWRDVARLARRRRLFATKTAVARAKATTKKTIEAWKSTILAARVSSHLADSMAHVRSRRRAMRVLRAWREEARRRRTARCLVAARVEAARAEIAAGNVLNVWREWTRTRVAKARVRDRHRAVRSAFLRSASFRGWALYAAYSRECEAIGTAVARNHERVVKASTVRGWRDAVFDSKLARADRRYFVWCGTRVWREWCAMASDGAVARRVAYARGWAKDRRLLADDLLRWRAAAAEAKSARIANDIATEHDDRRATRSGWRHWRVYVADAERARELAEKAEAHFAFTSARVAFARWRWASAATRRDAAADSFVLTWLARRTITRWRNQTERALMREARRRVAARHHYRATLRRVLCVVLPRFVEWSKTRNAVRAKAAAHHASVTRRKVMNAWRGPIVTEGRKDRLASRKASVMRDALLALKAFVSWRHWTEKRAAKNRALADADAHHGAVLLHRCVLAWDDWLSGKLRRREATGARVGAAARALGETKRFRIFAAWLEMAREGAVYRVQADRADAHRDERAKVCVVLAWLDHVDQCKKRRMDIVTADRFSRRRFMFNAMEAWVRRVVYRRRRVAGYANAVTWRRARTSRRVWRAWRAWLDRRGRKRAREEAALAMHRDVSMRDGARAWLAAGLESRDRRAERSARVAAEEAAAALVRAGKFARRWRHRVLGARESVARFEPFEREAVAGADSRICSNQPDCSSGGTVASSEDPYRPRLVGGYLGCKRADAEAPAVTAVTAITAVTPDAPRGFVSFPRLLHPTPPGLPTPPSPWVGRPPRTPPASTTSSAMSSASVMTPEDLKRHESVIVEHEALRAESARLAAEARGIDGDGPEDDARRRALEAAASHLRQRRRELLPAVRAAAAALGEAVALSDR